MKSGAKSASSEIGHVGCLRMGTCGRRQVILCSTLPLCRALGSTHTDGKVVLPSEAAASLKSMDAGMRDLLLKHHKGGQTCYHGTVGDGDVLIVPPGWIFSEFVSSSTDYAGVRMSYLCRGDFTVLDKMSIYLMKANKPSVLLTKAIDVIASLE